MRVLIIPEDYTLDEYVLKPVVEAIFKNLGRIAKIQVLRNPRLRGVDQALDPKQLTQIITSYPKEDLFLLLVDRDCEMNRINKVIAREQDAVDMEKWLLGCLAVEEVEMWALAIYQGKRRTSWQEMRQECHPKETYFVPLIKQLKLQNTIGHGRKRIMQSLSGRFQRLLKLCPEVAELRKRIRQKIEQSDSR